MDTYDTKFGPDIPAAIDAGEFHLVEVIKAADSDADPPSSRGSEHIFFDGSRLAFDLNPDNTEDDTYTTLEVSSTPRFNQKLLDYFAATGSMQCMLPGRQAVFKNIVFSESFADGSAASDPVTTGVLFQSWRGIEELGLTPKVRRPAFMAAAMMFIGGKGIMPVIASRSLRSRPFCALVFDFYSGIIWVEPVTGFDPSIPSDLTLRWMPNRNVEFLVNDRVVATYTDGKSRPYPLKFMGKQFFYGSNLLGHKYLVADPCHIDVWLNSSVMGNVPGVPNGMRVARPYKTALEGFRIEPIPSLPTGRERTNQDE